MFAARIGFFNQGSGADVTGGNSTIDGFYTVRTFTSNGTLSVSNATVNMTYLVVGAGGTGNLPLNPGYGGGGGGNVAQGTFTAGGTYTITIGDGATGNGISIISTVVSANKGGSCPPSGRDGGNSGIYFGGIGTYGLSSIISGGGGAGFGANGFDAVGTPFNDGGNGGNGIISNITGSNVYYAGGGGGYSGTGSGGVGGLGGGGNGGGNSAATPGTINTGGGGGSGDRSGGQDGGSGVVILRYLTPF
jgi:hypothetical protein